MIENNYARAMIGGKIVVSAVDAAAIVNKAIAYHKLSPIAAEALGRCLTVAALMGKQLKNDGDYMSATVDGGGSLGKITVCSNDKGEVKGTVDEPFCPSVYRADGSLDVGAAVGKNGKITVVKDVGLKQPYVGACEMVSGEIAQDFAAYFARSEQQPCALTLGLSFKNGKCVSGGGVLVQVLPGCDDALLEDVETTLYAMDEMSYQFSLHGAREVLEKFFGGYDGFFVTDEGVCKYKCDCSAKRIKRIIYNLGKAEAESIVAEQGAIEVQCHFCNKKYSFDGQQVAKLFEKSK